MAVVRAGLHDNASAPGEQCAVSGEPRLDGDDAAVPHPVPSAALLAVKLDEHRPAAAGPGQQRGGGLEEVLLLGSEASADERRDDLDRVAEEGAETVTYDLRTLGAAPHANAVRQPLGAAGDRLEEAVGRRRDLDPGAVTQRRGRKQPLDLRFREAEGDVPDAVAGVAVIRRDQSRLGRFQVEDGRPPGALDAGRRRQVEHLAQGTPRGGRDGADDIAREAAAGGEHLGVLGTAVHVAGKERAGRVPRPEHGGHPGGGGQQRHVDAHVGVRGRHREQRAEQARPGYGVGHVDGLARCLRPQFVTHLHLPRAGPPGPCARPRPRSAGIRCNGRCDRAARRGSRPR